MTAGCTRRFFLTLLQEVGGCKPLRRCQSLRQVPPKGWRCHREPCYTTGITRLEWGCLPPPVSLSKTTRRGRPSVRREGTKVFARTARRGEEPVRRVVGLTAEPPGATSHSSPP